MKIEAMVGKEVAQAIGGAASNLNTAIDNTFSLLLESFKSNTSKVRSTPPPMAVQSADPVKSPSEKIPATAKSSEVKPDNNHSAQTDGDVDSEAYETAESDAEKSVMKSEVRKAAPKSATEGKSVESDVTAQEVEAQGAPVKMEDLIKELDLTDGQVQELAQALNISVDQLKQMRVSVGQIQAGSFFAATDADGARSDLGQLLNANGADKGLAGVGEAARKIASILKLDDTQAARIFKSLNISAIEVKALPATAPKAAVETPVAVQAPDIKTGVETLAAPVAVVAPVAESKTAIESPVAEMKAAVNAAEKSSAPHADAKPEAVAQAPVADARPANAETDNGEANGFGTKGNAAAIEAAGKTDGSGKTATADFGAALARAGEAAGNATVKAVAANPAPAATEDAVKAHAERIMGQIAEKASFLQLPHATQTRITLNPVELGAVDIKLVMHDATLKASIMVDSNAVKQVVEQNLEHLKNALAGQGISVDEMRVSVDQRNSGSSHSGHDGNRQSMREANAPVAAKGADPAPRHFPRRSSANSLVDITA